ncbi:MAG: sugar transferase [Lentisphaeria bacterium]|nr:sugar transferase [Lentisphaeria bacterium]
MSYGVQRILAAVLLVLLFPLLLLIAAGCAVFSGFPVLFQGVRIGQNKKRFVIYKFRTMKENASPLTEEQEWEFARSGKLRDDPRVTFFGRFLRRFSLDELPQLWNVVRNDMALIGPRPIVDFEETIYGKYSTLIHSVKPGITGLWQVSGRNLTTYHRRIAINCYYVRHRCWKLDLWIVCRTFGAVLGGRGAF